MPSWEGRGPGLVDLGLSFPPLVPDQARAFQTWLSLVWPFNSVLLQALAGKGRDYEVVVDGDGR